MSYNILGDDNIRYGAYELLPPEIITWDLRKYRVIKKIARYMPDILFLQEVNTEACYFFKKKFKRLGYQAYCAFDLATFYKNNLFELSVVEKYGYSFGKGALKLTLLNNELVPFRIVNVHIKWDDKEPNVHQGCRQIIDLKNHLSNDSQFKNNNFTIIAGDFNLEPSHPCLQDLNKDFMDGQRDSLEPTFYGKNPARIDYIFFSKEWSLVKSEAVQRGGKNVRLPTLDEPSDHIPVSISLLANSITSPKDGI